jgi:hypothetical protein
MKNKFTKKCSWAWCLKPVILGTGEAKMRRILVPGQLETPSQPIAGCSGVPVIPAMQEDQISRISVLGQLRQKRL